MKLIIFLVLLGAGCLLSAADQPASHADPLAGAFFPPETILMAKDQIGLTEAQAEALRARVEKTQIRSQELKQQMEREIAALAALARQERVEEAALGAQLDKVLDVERESKHLHLGLMVAARNLLTPGQQAQLRKLVPGGGKEFAEAARARVSEKVARVEEGVQKMIQNGRDPSSIGKVMEGKVGPLLKAGKFGEAEAELDRVLEQLDQDAK
jgi:Spy/CpxP family protein refolding chaperone